VTGIRYVLVVLAVTVIIVGFSVALSGSGV
jgi:hypothetical protein